MASCREELAPTCVSCNRWHLGTDLVRSESRCTVHGKEDSDLFLAMGGHRLARQKDRR